MTDEMLKNMHKKENIKSTDKREYMKKFKER